MMHFSMVKFLFSNFQVLSAHFYGVRKFRKIRVVTVVDLFSIIIESNKECPECIGFPAFIEAMHVYAFEGGIWVLIASVPCHCILFAFRSHAFANF